MTPVELVGGPLDGHQTEVKMTNPDFDVWLFTWNQAGRRAVLAYAMAGRTTPGGKRWVLGFLYEVAKLGSRRKNEERGQETGAREQEEGGAA